MTTELLLSTFTDPDMDYKAFNPPKEWIREVLIIAQRYNANYGVRWIKSHYNLEPVHKGRRYVWTTNEEILRRQAAGLHIPLVPALGLPPPDYSDDDIMSGLNRHNAQKRAEKRRRMLAAL